jgi:GNAT superfamily N-acetyltransferase
MARARAASPSGRRPGLTRGEKATPSPVAIRAARDADRAFVLEAVERLADFETPPSWRTRPEIVEGEARTLRAFFELPPSGAHLLIAESGGRPLGFAYLETLRDYFTREEHGHVGILAVAKEAEGRGVGGALLEGAADWSRGRGFRRLTLNVFSANSRARRLYSRSGFEEESLRYVRRLEEE